MSVASSEVQPKETAGPRCRIVLVDDHSILRDGLRALLELEPDLEVVAEAGNYTDAVERVREFVPALLITDIVLPGRTGLELIGEVRKISPATRTIVLTAHDSEAYIRAGLDARADGYVLKDASRTELLMAIRMVASGHQFLCRDVSARIVSGYLCGGEEERSSAEVRNVTAREREVLTLIALGHANKTVARQLGLSVKTVEKHRSNIMRKLELHNAAGITRFALKNRLIGVDDATTPAAPDA